MTRSGVALVPARDAARWDALVTAHPGSTDYHRWAWLDLSADLLGFRIDRWLITVDGAPVGVFPLARRAGWAPDSPNLPFPFVGPLAPADVLPGVLRALRRRQFADGLLLARFDIGPADTTPDVTAALRAAGAEVVEDSTVVVDLSHGSVDRLHAGYARVRTRNVRRALQRGTAVRPARPGEFASLITDVLDEAYGSHDAPNPYPRDLGARVEAWAASRPWVTIWTATVHDEPAGAQVMLGGRPTALAWIGGCLRRFRDANPNALVHQVMLECALEAGHTQLDLSGWVDDQVGNYKLAFGGERRAYLSLRSSLLPAGARRAVKNAVGRLRG